MQINISINQSINQSITLTGFLDLDEYSSAEVVRAVVPLVHAMTFFLEEVQVNGITFLADCGGLTMKVLMWWGADKLKQQAEIMTVSWVALNNAKNYTSSCR